MANVIITLPKELWEKIVLKEKQYELRKNYPKINVLSSRVYVVIKGSTYVAGYFNVGAIWETDDFNQLWQHYGKQLGITFDWFCNYVYTVKHKAYLWQIDNVYRYRGNIDLEEYFGVKHNPQSFIYTDKEPFVPGYSAWFHSFSQNVWKTSGKPLQPYPLF